MYVVYLAGGIASGKSTAAEELERLGVARIDLDQVSREALAPGAPAVAAIAGAFGEDLVDGAGVLDRHALARRAFASADRTRRLEEIELPEIGRLTQGHVEALAACPDAPACCVIEVPLLDRVLGRAAFEKPDEVVAVACPYEQRRERAVGRGMDVADFERRASQQPDEAWLRAHADTVWDNADGAAPLRGQVGAWWRERFGARS